MSLLRIENAVSVCLLAFGTAVGPACTNITIETNENIDADSSQGNRDSETGSAAEPDLDTDTDTDSDTDADTDTDADMDMDTDADTDTDTDADMDTDTDTDADTDTDSDSDSDAPGDTCAGEACLAPTDTALNSDAGAFDDSDTGPFVECSEVGIGSGLLNTQYSTQSIGVAGSDFTYIIHSNWWYKFDGQTVSYDGLSFVVGNPNNAESGADVGAPVGYPSFFIGSYGGNNGRSNLPMPVSEIVSAPTSFHTNATDEGLSNKNAAYDVWFTKSGDPLPVDGYSPGSDGAYLMVWLFMPSDRQPRGANAHPTRSVKGVGGTWDVWIDDTNPPCISYVSSAPRNGLDFDLNAFIRDSVENDYGITEDMYLSVLFAGFEIWGQGDGLSVERFCAEVN